MSFTKFQFHNHINKAIQECGFTTPTPIQQKAISPILKRRDVLGLAQTGTGKTAAFVLPTVNNLLKSRGKYVRCLILAPTRELAEQIHDFTKTVTQRTHLRSVAVYGGVSKKAQVTQIRKGIDIVVACPGRLLDLANDGAIDLSRIDTLILDEADHMFDQGFLPDIRKILKLLPRQKQSLVFSATMPKEIRALTRDILIDPVTVQIDRIQPASSVDHALYEIDQRRKTSLLSHLLKQDKMAATIVFTKTKHKAKSLARQLEKAGIKATSLQGNLSQNKRKQALDGFKTGEYKVLVATDIASRGIDVNGISHVINYDVPDTAEAYIHRTGRTGRASQTGVAFTFATGQDRKLVSAIERSLNKKIARVTTPDIPNAPQQSKDREQTSHTTGKQVKAGMKKSSPASRRRGRRTSKNIFGMSAGIEQ